MHKIVNVYHYKTPCQRAVLPELNKEYILHKVTKQKGKIYE